MNLYNYLIAFLCVALGFTIGKGCENLPINPKETIKIEKLHYPKYINDTVKIISLKTKYINTVNTDSIKIPCGDTNFIVLSDTVFVPSGDTINMSFNYFNNLGRFGLEYKPKADSIIYKTIELPTNNDTGNNVGYFVGSFGIGAILGILVSLQK